MIWFIIIILCYTKAKDALYVLYYNFKWYIFAFTKEIVMYCNKEKKAKALVKIPLRLFLGVFYFKPWN